MLSPLSPVSLSLSQGAGLLRWQLQPVTYLTIIAHQPLHSNPVSSVSHCQTVPVIHVVLIALAALCEKHSMPLLRLSVFLPVPFYSPQSPLLLGTPAHLHGKLPLALNLLPQRNLNSLPSHYKTLCIKVCAVQKSITSVSLKVKVFFTSKTRQQRNKHL